MWLWYCDSVMMWWYGGDDDDDVDVDVDVDFDDVDDDPMQYDG